MPLVAGHWEDMLGNRLILEQQNYDPEQERQMANEDIHKMNMGQRVVHDQILTSAKASDA